MHKNCLNKGYQHMIRIVSQRRIGLISIVTCDGGGLRSVGPL